MPINDDINCPNYIDNELKTEYYYYDNELDGTVTDIFKTNHPEYNDITSYEELTVPDSKRCFNICGPNYYIENNNSESVCLECPDKPQGWTMETPINETEEIRNLREGGVLGMCRDFNENSILKDRTPGDDGGDYDEPEWYERQQSFNIKRNLLQMIDWTSDYAMSLWENYTDDENPKMTDQDLRSMFGRRLPGEFESDGRTPIYVLPDIYGDPNDPDAQMMELRNEINLDRGSIVSGCPVESPVWDCNGENYGPTDIIYEEALDYLLSTSEDTYDIQETENASIQEFNDLVSGVNISPEFENCVNEKLNTDQNDFDIQERIKNYKKITDFNQEDINYLKSKLRRIILITSDDLEECMELLNISQSICTTGVSDKMLQIGHLVLSIIGGGQININNLNSNEKRKFKKIIDELGPMIPRAIKNIIKISKEYEMNVCRNPSNTTLLLERLYIDLYDKQVNVELFPTVDSLFLGLLDTPKTIDGNIRYFKKIIIICAFLYFLFKILK